MTSTPIAEGFCTGCGATGVQIEHVGPGERLCSTCHRKPKPTPTGNPYDLYEAMANQWARAGGSPGWHIGPKLWAAVRRYIGYGSRTFETGSGLSTWLFAMCGCEHLALEASPHWFSVVTGSPFVQSASVLLRELTPEPDDAQTFWYEWEPTDSTRPFDVVLVDGPNGKIGRGGVVDRIFALAHDQSVIFVDDANRPEERAVAVEIGTRLQLPVDYHPAGEEAGRLFAQIGG